MTESCELHVKQLSQWGAVHSVWDAVKPRLRSVSLLCDDYVMRALPSIFHGAANLAMAWLEVEKVGTEGAPLHLRGPLADVKELVVKCTSDLHAIVPAHVAWRNVTLSAQNALDLHFEAVVSFANTIPAFCFRYFSLQVGCPWAVLGLCSLLQYILAHQACSAFIRERCCWTWWLSWQGGTRSGMGVFTRVAMSTVFVFHWHSRLAPSGRPSTAAAAGLATIALNVLACCILPPVVVAWTGREADLVE